MYIYVQFLNATLHQKSEHSKYIIQIIIGTSMIVLLSSFKPRKNDPQDVQQAPNTIQVEYKNKAPSES